MNRSASTRGSPAALSARHRRGRSARTRRLPTRRRPLVRGGAGDDRAHAAAAGPAGLGHGGARSGAALPRAAGRSGHRRDRRHGQDQRIAARRDGGAVGPDRRAQPRPRAARRRGGGRGRGSGGPGDAASRRSPASSARRSRRRSLLDAGAAWICGRLWPQRRRARASWRRRWPALEDGSRAAPRSAERSGCRGRPPAARWRRRARRAKRRGGGRAAARRRGALRREIARVSTSCWRPPRPGSTRSRTPSPASTRSWPRRWRARSRSWSSIARSSSAG